MKVNSIYLLTLLFTSCTFNTDTQKLPDDLEAFDTKHAAFIDKLCDSLIRSIAKDTSYVMEFRPRSSAVMFSYKDDQGNGLGYFRPGYQLNPALEAFFNDGSIAEIYYDKHFKTFSGKLFSFKEGDKAVRLTVFPDTTHIVDTSDVVYRKDNRVYTEVDAW